MDSHGCLVDMIREITAITVQKHNTGRLNISLDGEYALSLDRLTAAWLKVGRKLSDEDIKTLKARDEQETAFNRTLHYLSFRARSEAELLTYLSEKGYSDSVSQIVMERLKAEGLISDKRFASDWIDNRVSFRPRSQFHLRAELRRKGIQDEIIDSALQRADLDDLALAMEAGKKLARRYLGSNWQDFRKKMIPALGRRGFDYETANSVTRQLWEETQTQHPGRNEKMEQ